MKHIFLMLLFGGIASYFGMKTCRRFGSASAPLPAPAPVQSAVSPSPAPVSRPVQRPRPVVKRDFAVSYWGDRGAITGGQGRSGIVWSRPPDGWEWDVPFWYYEDRDEKTLLPLSPHVGSSSPPPSEFAHFDGSSSSPLPIVPPPFR